MLLLASVVHGCLSQPSLSLPWSLGLVKKPARGYYPVVALVLGQGCSADSGLSTLVFLHPSGASFTLHAG